jgi:hypothetical protein
VAHEAGWIACGKDNYPIDRQVGDEMSWLLPDIAVDNDPVVIVHARALTWCPWTVPSTRWRPEAGPFGEPAPVDQYCAVARKP